MWDRPDGAEMVKWCKTELKWRSNTLSISPFFPPQQRERPEVNHAIRTTLPTRDACLRLWTTPKLLFAIIVGVDDCRLADILNIHELHLVFIHYNHIT